MFSVLQLGVDGVDEAAHGSFVSVVEGQRGRDVGVAEFERGGVVLAVGGVLLELLLAFGVVGGLLLVGGYLLVLLRGGGFAGRDLLPGT